MRLTALRWRMIAVSYTHLDVYKRQCNNICNTLLKWYENLAVELDIPCIVIDVPFNHTMPIPEYAKAYIADQFRNAISQLEVICGRPFDWKKFKEVKDQTQRSVYHWNRIADMAQYKPSPLNGFDLFNYMALILSLIHI